MFVLCVMTRLAARAASLSTEKTSDAKPHATLDAPRVRKRALSKISREIFCINQRNHFNMNNQKKFKPIGEVEFKNFQVYPLLMTFLASVNFTSY